MTNDRFSDDSNDESALPKDFEELLRNMLSGQAGGMNIDPSELAQAAGLPFDQHALDQMFGALRAAMSGNTDGSTDWSVARKTAIEVAATGGEQPNTGSLQTAFSTASLWLDTATTMGASADAPREMQRVEWVQHTIDTWIEMAEPVADSIADALTTTLNQQLPEEMQGMIGQAADMLRGIGGTLFAMQLGQIVGTLAREVLSGGDIGMPLLAGPGREGGALLPENLAAFAEGLDQDRTEVELFLATRELAYSRLFRHSKWLRSHLLSAIQEYARGIEINMDHLEDIAVDLDPSDHEQLQEVLRSGQLIPPKTARQEAAHERLETMIALVDGYVDVVTREATRLLPGGVALAEMIRRRRAAGGPSERAFGSLVGLELRPRKLREAASMWEAIGTQGSIEARDGLWAHPDFLPTIAEIEDPSLVLQRLGIIDSETDPEEAEFQRELERLLDEGSAADEEDRGDAQGN